MIKLSVALGDHFFVDALHNSESVERGLYHKKLQIDVKKQHMDKKSSWFCRA